jgi:hypothetical protein
VWTSIPESFQASLSGPLADTLSFIQSQLACFPARDHLNTTGPDKKKRPCHTVSLAVYHIKLVHIEANSICPLSFKESSCGTEAVYFTHRRGGAVSPTRGPIQARLSGTSRFLGFPWHPG